MNKAMQKLKILVILALLQPGLFSQLAAQEKEVVRLSLKEAIKIAEENNWDINKARANVDLARADYRTSNSVFLPNVNLAHTGIATNDPLSAFGFKLKQEITTQADFNPALLNNPDRIENFNTRVEVEQPLINFDGIYGRKAANAMVKAFQYQKDRTIHQIRFEVKKSYYQLQLALEAKSVFNESLQAAKANLELTENHLKQGYVKEADVLAARVRVLDLENQLTDAQNNVKLAGEFLAFLLGMDIHQGIETTDQLMEKPFPLDLEESVTTEFRSDLLAYQQGVEARKNQLKSKKMQFLPRLNAFGSYEWNDDQIFGTSANNYMVGAKLSWNLFSGYKNLGSVQKAKAELQKSELDYGQYVARNSMEVQEARRNLRVTFQKIEVSRMAREQAKESLRIRTNRYEQGLEKTTDLLFAETMNSAKELEYLNALYQYQVALFHLELLLEKEL